MTFLKVHHLRFIDKLPCVNSRAAYVIKQKTPVRHLLLPSNVCHRFSHSLWVWSNLGVRTMVSSYLLALLTLKPCDCTNPPQFYCWSLGLSHRSLTVGFPDQTPEFRRKKFPIWKPSLVTWQYWSWLFGKKGKHNVVKSICVDLGPDRSAFELKTCHLLIMRLWKLFKLLQTSHLIYDWGCQHSPHPLRAKHCYHVPMTQQKTHALYFNKETPAINKNK